MHRIELIVTAAAACIVFATGCKVVVPNATTVEGLGSLEPGMDKTEVLMTLKGVYPHDIYNGEGVGCEVHEYRYKHPYQDVKRADRLLRKGLRGNPRKFLRTGKAFAIYRDGALETVFTEKEKDFVPYLLASKRQIDVHCDPPVLGCKDPESINYNPQATADDGSCVFCPCGYIKNATFKADRPVSECNQPCIKDDTRCKTCPTGQRPNPEYDRYRPDSDCNRACIPCVGPCQVMPDSLISRTCGPCELIESLGQAEGASVNLYLDMSAEGTGATPNSRLIRMSTSGGSKSGARKSESRTRKTRKKNLAPRYDKPMSPEELKKIVDVYTE